MNILLVTDIPPSREYTAGLVEEGICHLFKRFGISFSLVIIKHPEVNGKIPKEIQIYSDLIIKMEKRNEQTNNLSKVKKNINYFFNEVYSRLILPNRIKKLVCHKKWDLIWGFAQGQTMINLIGSLSNLLKVPYNVQVWDSPDWWLKEHCFSKFYQKRVINQFRQLLKSSNYCIAASPYMAEAYQNEIGCKTTYLMPFLEKLRSINIDEIEGKKENDRCFKIVFAGQKYAKKELMTFLEALDTINWCYKEKKINLFIYSNYVDEEILNKYPLVRQVGWIDQKQLFIEIEESDLAYCPYPFSEEMINVSSLSFPAKLTTYIRCLTPVFIHSPEYSSIFKFVQQYKMGYVCSSLDIKKIIQVLLSALTDTREEIRNKKKKSIEVFNNHLSEDIMKENILKSLNNEDITC